MDFGFFVLLLIVIAIGFGFVYFKVIDHPEERFRKNALSMVNRGVTDTVPGDVAHLKISTLKRNNEGEVVKKKFVDDLLIDVASLDDKKTYYIGRISGNLKSDKFEYKKEYLLGNKNLYYGIKTLSKSSLSRKHIQFAIDYSKKSAGELIVALVEPERSNNLVHEYRYGDDEFKKLAYDNWVVAKKTVCEINSGDYAFEFKLLSDVEFEDLISDYVSRHENHKEEKPVKISLKRKREDEFATAPSDDNKPVKTRKRVSDTDASSEEATDDDDVTRYEPEKRTVRRD